MSSKGLTDHYNKHTHYFSSGWLVGLVNHVLSNQTKYKSQQTAASYLSVFAFCSCFDDEIKSKVFEQIISGYMLSDSFMGVKC